MLRKWFLLLTFALLCSLSASSTDCRYTENLHRSDNHLMAEHVTSTGDANREKESNYNYFQFHSSSSCLSLVNTQSRPFVIVYGNNSHFNYFSQLRQSLLSLQYFSSVLTPIINNADYKYLFNLSQKHCDGFYIYALCKMLC